MALAERKEMIPLRYCRYYINNGKLFVGPHLIAGGGVVVLVLATALGPALQKGHHWHCHRQQVAEFLR